MKRWTREDHARYEEVLKAAGGPPPKRPLRCLLGLHIRAEWTSGANYWWCAHCRSEPDWPPPY
jgi:hypothetical protein